MENTNKDSWISWIVGVVIVIGLGYLVFAQKPVSAPTGNGDATSTAMDVKPTEGEVVIGYIAPMTGDVAVLGVPIQKAVLLAVEEINAKGGINGAKVVIKTEDAKCDEKEAATAVQKLINIDKVQAIIGGGCSSETLGMAPIMNEKKVVAVSYGSTSSDITTKGGDYVFRLAPSDVHAGKVAARYAVDKLSVKKVAVLSENTDYAQGLRKIFAETVKTNSRDVTFDESYNTGVTDFKTQALKIKNSGAEVVYVLPQSPAAGVNIIKALRDQKITSQILTAGVMLSPEVAKQNSELLEGVIGFESYFDVDTSSAKKFRDAYKAKYNEDLTYAGYMANAYSTVYLFKDLIEKYGNDGQKLQQALSVLTKWTGGALSEITLDSQGDIDWRAFSVKKIKAGALEKLEVYNL